jgi:hypothetical protein
MAQDRKPTTWSELEALWNDQLARLDAILCGRAYCETKGQIAEWQKWAFYSTKEQ